MAKLRLTAATAAALLLAPASWAVPAPLTEPLLPPITPAGTVSIAKLFTVPADVPTAAGSTARVQYVVPDPGSSSRVFINDVNGILYTSPSVNQTPAPYLDLRTKGIGFLDLAELDGFSGVAFHPNFSGNPETPGYGVFYTLSSATTTGAPLTFLTGDAGSHTTALTEWKTTNPAGATFTGTSRTVMTIGDAAGGHNGGTIAFNPTAALGSADYGKLYCLLQNSAADE